MKILSSFTHAVYSCVVRAVIPNLYDCLFPWYTKGDIWRLHVTRTRTSVPFLKYHKSGSYDLCGISHIIRPLKTEEQRTSHRNHFYGTLVSF